MIELKPFTSSDFEVFKSWTKTPEELFQFAGPLFTFPLNDEQLNNYLKNNDLKPFKVILKETNEVVGHCEMNFANGNYRLSRVLVGRKDLRGKKIGEQIIRALSNKFFKNSSINQVDLNTFSWNKAAIKCYEKVGFRINPKETTKMMVNGQEWTRINMVLSRPSLTE